MTTFSKAIAQEPIPVFHKEILLGHAVEVEVVSDCYTNYLLNKTILTNQSYYILLQESGLYVKTDLFSVFADNNAKYNKIVVEEYTLVSEDVLKNHLHAAIDVPAKYYTEEVTPSMELRGASYSLPGINTSLCPPCDCPDSHRVVSLRSAIIHLNDYHRWTREKIADWLDEISDPTGENGPDLRFKLKEES